jgi:hypothetical protein
VLLQGKKSIVLSMAEVLERGVREIIKVCISGDKREPRESAVLWCDLQGAKLCPQVYKPRHCSWISVP